ncbi:hypothetical protein [Lysinibacillus sp. 3P01SB]|uniref:hypothetical protein n=1 Tax=Lysinibacillus sp. 3P01SB TaxID=3132284 RepID=UPI0039A5E442
MKYILLIIAIVVIFVKGNWYVRGKRINNNLVRYSIFSILSSVILAILHMNMYDTFDGDIIKDELISVSAIFTAYMIIFIFYPILRNTIHKYSD